MHGTTIVAVRRGNRVALAGDGQVTTGEVILKSSARKIRKLFHDRVIGGFAGSVADALTLFDKFESQLERQSGNLKKAAVELAKEWRTDRTLRRLEAWLIVADTTDLLVVSGEGEVIEPDDEVAAIGSGGGYAQAAARALLRFTDLSAGVIARESLEIAATICIYTNAQIEVVELPDGRSH